MEIKVSGYFQELFIPKYVYIYNMYTIFKHMIHIIVYPNLRGNMMNMMINPWPAASHPGLAPISQVLPTNLLLLHFHWTQSPLHLGTNPTSGEKNRAFLVIWKNIGKFKNQIGIYIYRLNNLFHACLGYFETYWICLGQPRTSANASSASCRRRCSTCGRRSSRFEWIFDGNHPYNRYKMKYSKCWYMCRDSTTPSPHRRWTIRKKTYIIRQASPWSPSLLVIQKRKKTIQLC